MKKVFFTIVFCFFIISCKSRKELQPNIPSLYYSYEKLNDKMELQNREYKGEIRNERIKDVDIFHYKYDSISYTLNISNEYYSDFIPLFKNGILHPQLISCVKGTAITIGQFKEIDKTANETKRRYKLWRWCKGVMNPCEYTIELLNKSAKKHTSTKEFIENASIVNISQCSVIL